jgi:hypothetical protein
MAWWREELMIDDFQTIVDLRLEEKEFALRSIQKSTIHNRQSSIDVRSALGRMNPVAVNRAKIRRAVTSHALI